MPSGTEKGKCPPSDHGRQTWQQIQSSVKFQGELSNNEEANKVVFHIFPEIQGGTEVVVWKTQW